MPAVHNRIKNEAKKSAKKQDASGSKKNLAPTAAKVVKKKGLFKKKGNRKKR